MKICPNVRPYIVKPHSAIWVKPLAHPGCCHCLTSVLCLQICLSIYLWCLWGVFKPLAHPGCCHYSPLSLPLSLDECRPASGRKHAQMKENCFSIPNLTALVEPKIANLIKNKCLSIVFFTSGKNYYLFSQTDITKSYFDICKSLNHYFQSKECYSWINT